MRDFNTHSPAWYSRTTGYQAAARSILIAHSLTNPDLTIVNLRNPAYPDLTIASTRIVIDSEWLTLTTLNSDHLPILDQLGRWTSQNLLTAPSPALKRRTRTRSLVRRRNLLCTLKATGPVTIKGMRGDKPPAQKNNLQISDKSRKKKYKINNFPKTKNRTRKIIHAKNKRQINSNLACKFGYF